MFAKWANDMATALDAIHGQKILHLDIKPKNVFIDENHNANIGDFGLAVKIDNGKSDLRGTPGYLAPEVLKKNAGPESDWYSYGVTLFKLYTGKDFNKIASIRNVFGYFFRMSQPYFYNRFLNDRLKMVDDPEIRNLLNKLLQFDPKQRGGYTDVQQFLAKHTPIENFSPQNAPNSLEMSKQTPEKTTAMSHNSLASNARSISLSTKGVPQWMKWGVRATIGAIITAVVVGAVALSATSSLSHSQLSNDTTNIYPVFYGNWSNNQTSMMENVLKNFDTSCSQSQGGINPAMQLKNTTLLNATFTTMNSTEIQNLIQNQIAANVLPQDPNGIYWVMTNPNVQETMPGLQLDPAVENMLQCMS